MMRKGTKCGTCVICQRWGLVSQHHSKPATATQNKEGPTWMVCSLCHTEMHRAISNDQLRAMNAEDVRKIILGKFLLTPPPHLAHDADAASNGGPPWKAVNTKNEQH